MISMTSFSIINFVKNFAFPIRLFRILLFLVVIYIPLEKLTFVLYAAFSTGSKILSHDIYRDFVMDPVYRLEGRSKFRNKIPKIYKTTNSLLYLSKFSSSKIPECDREIFFELQEDIRIFSNLYKDVWDEITGSKRTKNSLVILDKISETKAANKAIVPLVLEKQRKINRERRALGLDIPERLKDNFETVYKNA